MSISFRGAAGIATFVRAFGESVVGQLVLLPEQLGVAAGQLADGNVSEALTTVLNAALAPIVQAVVDTLLFNPEVYSAFQEALAQPFTNLLNVINLTSYPNVLNLLGPLLAPVQLLSDVTSAVGAAGDGIVSGIRNGNLEEVANALLSLGPDVTYALLNGNPVGPAFSAGLLGPQGIIAGLLTLRDMVAEAITPPAASGLAAADAMVETAAKTVTLEVEPEVSTAQAAPEVVEAQPVSGSGESTEAESTTDTEAPEEPVVTSDEGGAAPEDAVTPTEESPTEESPVEDSPGADTEEPAGDDSENAAPDTSDTSSEAEKDSPAADSDSPQGRAAQVPRIPTVTRPVVTRPVVTPNNLVG